MDAQQQPTTGAAAPQPRGMSPERFRAQFKKTELCTFFARKKCFKGQACPYAHGEEELHRAPDLTKTSLCRKWLKRSCTLSRKECPFAHGTCDLRRTSAYFAQAAGGREEDKVAEPISKEQRTTQKHAADIIAHPPQQAAPLQAPGGAAVHAGAGPASPSRRRGSDACDRRLAPTTAGVALSEVPAAPPAVVAAMQMWPVVALQPFVAVSAGGPALGPSAPLPAQTSAASNKWQEDPASEARCLELVKSVALRAAVSSESELEALLLRAMPEHYED